MVKILSVFVAFLENMNFINKIVMAALCRIRIPEAYKEANEFFADEFLFQKLHGFWNTKKMID